MTYVWQSGAAVPVVCQDGQPVRFRWGKRQHRVQRIVQRWRVHTGWWDQPLWRDYFRLVTADGMLLTLYHDLLSDKWYVSELYD